MKTFPQLCNAFGIKATLPAQAHEAVRGLAPDSHKHCCYPPCWRPPFCLSAFKRTVLTQVKAGTTTPGSYGGESIKAQVGKGFSRV